MLERQQPPAEGLRAQGWGDRLQGPWAPPGACPHLWERLVENEERSSLMRRLPARGQQSSRPAQQTGGHTPGDARRMGFREQGRFCRGTPAPRPRALLSRLLRKSDREAASQNVPRICQNLLSGIEFCVPRFKWEGLGEPPYPSVLPRHYQIVSKTTAWPFRSVQAV